MAVIDRIKKLSKSLFPTGRAFKMPVGGSFEKLMSGLAASEERAYEDALSILDSAIPDNDNFTEEDAAQWERRLGLIVGSGTLEQRKQAIIRKMNHPGIVKARQHRLFLETQLQAAGFEVGVIENIDLGGIGLNHINPGEEINLAVWKTRVNSVDNNFTKVTFGNGQFVAIANSGTGNRVMASVNGITWTTQTTPQDNNWRSVTYGNNLYVAVSSDGANRVMTSPDGVTWTVRTAAAAIQWRDVTYGNGKFVAVGQSSSLDVQVVMTSVNGIDWVIQDAFADKALVAVAYGNGKYVAIGQNFSMHSTNGEDWVESDINANQWVAICFGENRFIAIANDSTNRVALSTDLGVTWEYFSVPNALYTGVCFGDNHFVAVSSDSDTIFSIDGRVWHTLESAVGNTWQSVINGLNLFIAVSSNGTSDRVMSLNIENEKLLVDKIDDTNDRFFFLRNTKCTFFIGELIANYDWVLSSPENRGWSAITFGENIFVAVGISGTGDRVMTSPDGIIWNIRNSAADNSWIGVTHGNGVFVAVSGNGANRVMTSPDGITWTLRTAGVANVWRSIAFGNGTFVIVGNGSGGVYVSVDDGVTWTNYALGAPESGYTWRDVTFGNGLFVAVGDGATNDNVMTSPDGITWTLRTGANTNDYESVIFGNGIFVAVSINGVGNRVMTSTDGINWTERLSAANHLWTSVTFGNGLFVAVTSDVVGNNVMTSPDGINWTSRNGADDLNWSAVGYGNGRFVAVSSASSMYSDFYSIGSQDVDIERKDEFRQLILRLKPKQTTAYLMVNYV